MTSRPEGGGGRGSRILWQHYSGLSNKKRDDGGRGVNKCPNSVTSLLDDPLLSFCYCHSKSLERTLTKISFLGKTAVFAGITQEGMDNVTLCWNFRSSGGSSAFLQPCTSGFLACFRPGANPINIKQKSVFWFKRFQLGVLLFTLEIGAKWYDQIRIKWAVRLFLDLWNASYMWKKIVGHSCFKYKIITKLPHTWSNSELSTRESADIQRWLFIFVWRHSG